VRQSVVYRLKHGSALENQPTRDQRIRGRSVRPFDADRVDYIVRNAYSAGPKTGIDIERLVHDMEAIHRCVSIRDDSWTVALNVAQTQFTSRSFREPRSPVYLLEPLQVTVS
jgi:HD superfamily phosphohydrolase